MVILNVNHPITNNTSQNGKFSIQRSLNKIFFIYKKGFWKFWLIYLSSLLIIKGIMLSFYWLINYAQTSSFIGFSVTQSEYYMRAQDYFLSTPTLGQSVSDSTFITKSFAIYFILQVLYQTFLAIPFVLSILVAKNVFDHGNEKMRKQLSNVTLVIGPVLIIGVITSILVQVGSYLWYIPGLLAMTFTSLVFPILIDEKLKPIATIKRSFTIVRGQFVNILGIILLFFAGEMAVLLIGKFFAWLLVHDPAYANKLLTVKNTLSIIYSYEIVQSIIFSIVAPFTAISSYVIYREAIAVRTFDLTSMVDSTATYVEENRSAISIDNQLTNVVKTETKDLIKGKYCSNCGAKLDDNAQFCESCGIKV